MAPGVLPAGRDAAWARGLGHGARVCARRQASRQWQWRRLGAHLARAAVGRNCRRRKIKKVNKMKTNHWKVKALNRSSVEPLKRRTLAEGFTLIELLVVIAII